MSENRYDLLMTAAARSGLDGLALNPGPSLIYLTGLPFHLMERPTVLLACPGAKPLLILPELERAKLTQSKVPLQAVSYGDNPASWQSAIDQAMRQLDLEGKTIGVEPGRLRFLEMSYLQKAAPGIRLVSAESLLVGLRMQKDQEEISAMRAAVRIAQAGLLATLPMIRVGMSERQVANELVIQLLRAGSDPEMPFAPIVSSGPNSANPHASPSDRLLQRGDLLVIDWGAAKDGYCADLTRTFAVGEVEEEYHRIHRLVLAANIAGREAVRTGIRAGDVDRAARAQISAGGYGAFFTHRTGHGLGMEGHEEPYIFGENDLLLSEGMTFTVEPGIYLPSRGGVRIEDNVVVTTTGCECLSDLPRELVRVE
jgi:Xaa-Pro dipeptidase